MMDNHSQTENRYFIRGIKKDKELRESHPHLSDTVYPTLSMISLSLSPDEFRSHSNSKIKSIIETILEKNIRLNSKYDWEDEEKVSVVYGEKCEEKVEPIFEGKVKLPSDAKERQNEDTKDKKDKGVGKSKRNNLSGDNSALM